MSDEIVELWKMAAMLKMGLDQVLLEIHDRTEKPKCRNARKKTATLKPDMNCDTHAGDAQRAGNSASKP